MFFGNGGLNMGVGYERKAEVPVNEGTGLQLQHRCSAWKRTAKCNI